MHSVIETRRKARAVEVCLRDSGQTLYLPEPLAGAVEALDQAGLAGCNASSHQQTNWPDAVYRLRQLGLEIDTRDDLTGGTYRGRACRYVLRSPVTFRCLNGEDR